MARLALVACEGPATGPWVRTRGNETGVQITQLGEGERIVMDQEANGSPKEPVLFEAEGTFPLSAGWDKLRFRKEGSGKLTSVCLV